MACKDPSQACMRPPSEAGCVAARLQESRELGHSYISPEHVVLALFSVGNVGAAQVIQK